MDRQCVYGMGHQVKHTIIHQAVPRQRRQTGKARCRDVHAVMSRTTRRASVAGVQVRLVFDRKRHR